MTGKQKIMGSVKKNKNTFEFVNQVKVWVVSPKKM